MFTAILTRIGSSVPDIRAPVSAEALSKRSTKADPREAGEAGTSGGKREMTSRMARELSIRPSMMVMGLPK